jgi:cephalosporin hydroxylase
VREFNRRVDFVRGSTVDPAIVTKVRRMVAGYRTMVILDSDHDAPHVAAELSAYVPLVTPGCYLIVQDGFVNGHPLEPDHGPGPYEAVQDFLATDDGFEVDRTRERKLFTFNPSGFLRRR